MPHPTWMGRSEWFQCFKYPQVVRAEDQALLLNAYPKSCFAGLDNVLVGYRQQPFSLAKTFLARKNLFTYQSYIFIKRHEWNFFAMALFMFALKLMVDLIASVPYFEKVFFNRMSNSIHYDDVKQFESLMLTFKNSNHHA